MKIFLIQFWILLFGLHSVYGIPIHEFVTEETNSEFESPITPMMLLNTMENLFGKLLFDNNNFSTPETSTIAGKVIDTTLDVPDISSTKGSDSHAESTSEMNAESENLTLQNNPGSTMSAPIEISETEPESKLPLTDIKPTEGSDSDSESTPEIHSKSESTTLQNNPSSTISGPIESTDTEPENKLPMTDIDANNGSGSVSESTFEKTTLQTNPSSTISAANANSETEPETKLPLSEEHHESKTSETTEIAMTSTPSEIVATSTDTKHEHTTFKETLMGAEDNDMLSNETEELSTSSENIKTVKPELLINFESKGDELTETSTENSVHQTQPDTQGVSSTTINAEKETPPERYTVIYLTTTETVKTTKHDDKPQETATEIHSTSVNSETEPQSIESTVKPDNLIMATEKPTVAEFPMVAINTSNYNEFSIINGPQNEPTPSVIVESSPSSLSEGPEDLTTKTNRPETTSMPDIVEDGSGSDENRSGEQESESINKFVIENLTVQSVPNVINNSFTTAGPPAPERHANGTIIIDQLNTTSLNVTSETDTSAAKTTTTIASTATNSKIIPTTTFSPRPSIVPVSTITPNERVNKETSTSFSTSPPTVITQTSILKQPRSPKENGATQPQTASVILIAFSFFYCRILI